MSKNEVVAEVPVIRAQIEAVIIRADGTREELGVISYYHKSWWRRMLWRLFKIAT